MNQVLTKAPHNFGIFQTAIILLSIIITCSYVYDAMLNVTAFCFMLRAIISQILSLRNSLETLEMCNEDNTNNPDLS